MPQHTVAVLVGSLRAASWSRKTAEALATLAQDLRFVFVEIGDLAFYDEDLEKDDVPEPWSRFRNQIRSADAVLLVTPEYNRSVPSVLKNAIDVGSRPYGKSVFAGKPAAIMSVSPGAIGGFGANHHLRQMATFLDMPMLQQPEVYIGGAAKLLNGEGDFADVKTRALFQRFADAFAAWIERHQGASVRS